MICSREPSIQELLLDDYSRNSSIQELLLDDYSRNSSIQELLVVDDLQQEIIHLRAPRCG
jgi:hypothetical protein